VAAARITGGHDLRAPGGAQAAAPASSRRAVEGFTLLEVMIALAILAAAMLTVSQIVGGSLRNHVRARQLEVATLLARGKMVELESEYERKGFRDFDEGEEGTFEEEGHPEVRWSTEVVKPEVELSAERILQMLTGGEGGLEELLAAAQPQQAQGGPGRHPGRPRWRRGSRRRSPGSASRSRRACARCGSRWRGRTASATNPSRS
jgi:type II secretion system protein I